MNEYIATFYSHFGALSYYKALKERGIAAKLMPVPRRISASCGTCVSYEHSEFADNEFADSDEFELEAVYAMSNGGFECVFRK